MVRVGVNVFGRIGVENGKQQGHDFGYVTKTGGNRLYSDCGCFFFGFTWEGMGNIKIT